ncbi:MOSC domain-containing protein [Aestuariivivens sediminicola]|uniref:MOSC domain-containing protein n=1 Tax=Aestuariivivens sediminicola TaxID=2913560 RepID=UPI001F5AFD91|nr:MOSC domain-containing protein [Aestuariivivens sediminicola]
MKIISTNIAKSRTIIWNGKQETTGIYKAPTEAPIFLGKNDVKGDEVTDRRYHGGEFKACYMYPADQYPYWKALYPQLQWQWGMFGENLTVEGLDETRLFIGDIYKVGGALVQITQPREPCYKLGIRFGNQLIIKQFIDHGYSGTYIRVLKAGYVSIGDVFNLVEQAEHRLSIFDFNRLLFAKNKDRNHIELAQHLDALPQKKRDKLKAYLK